MVTICPNFTVLAVIRRAKFERRLTGALWKGTFELREQRRNNPSRLRNERIAKALRVLQSELPQMLADVRKLVPEDHHKQYQPVIDLLILMDQIARHFSKDLPRRGHDTDQWHIVARKVGALIVAAFKRSGRDRIGLGKPTSPAIEVLQRGLGYLGQNVSPEAIVDALRPKRVRKRLGKITR
jgi:hypothetical protein